MALSVRYARRSKLVPLYLPYTPSLSGGVEVLHGQHGRVEPEISEAECKLCSASLLNGRDGLTAPL